MAQSNSGSSFHGLTLHDLTVVSVRIYALYLLLSSFIYAINYLVFFLSMEWKSIPGSNPYLSSLSFFISAGTALLLLAKSRVLAEFILGGLKDSRVEWSIDASGLSSVALKVLGIFFLVSGLQGLSGQGIRWLLSPKDELTGMRAHLQWDVAPATSAAVQFLAGVVLIIGFRRFACWFSQAREFFSLKDDSPAASDENQEDSADKETARKPDR